MKLLFLTLIVAFIFGSAPSTSAQTNRQISVRVGKQKKDTRSKLTVKFISLVEDSRCPEGTNCVWAGNATIKVAVFEGGQEVKTFEANTNIGAQGETYGAYAVKLVSLTPSPKENVRLNRNAYTATFSISRLTR